MIRRRDRTIPVRILVSAWFLAGAVGLGALFRLAWTEAQAPQPASLGQVERTPLGR